MFIEVTARTGKKRVINAKHIFSFYEDTNGEGTVLYFPDNSFLIIKEKYEDFKVMVNQALAQASKFIIK